MNPLTNMKNLNKMNERELQMGYTNSANSWHNQYKDSAWIFVGGLDYALNEADVICVFSQYGEIVNVNLVRDAKTGKSKGFAFVCYEDQRSTILAVDNFNGSKVASRSIRVDHVENYRKPKETDNEDDIRRTLREKGCAPDVMDELRELEKKKVKLEKMLKAEEEVERASASKQHPSTSSSGTGLSKRSEGSDGGEKRTQRSGGWRERSPNRHRDQWKPPPPPPSGREHQNRGFQQRGGSGGRGRDQRERSNSGGGGAFRKSGGGGPAWRQDSGSGRPRNGYHSGGGNSYHQQQRYFRSSGGQATFASRDTHHNRSYGGRSRSNERR